METFLCFGKNIRYFNYTDKRIIDNLHIKSREDSNEIDDYYNSAFFKIYNISVIMISFLYFNITLYFYLKNRNHYLIKNKQVPLCVAISFICEIFCIGFPLSRLVNIDCWLQLWLTWFTATPKMIL
ncbi:hypothetical protein BCR36DRAFT_153748 [Piromyces finnis]|uniref:Uncharacterized protein n=1 Tax=Piromyces finnis TaxID=1754191 RepID=A0A1Y1VIM4_9FUNG|nr:hypothetical protein BCR36DRAFT_153748 [Piromyces finnis]|eukprot:ORX57243.1 hypothetical protein BCR36DRAFT_153748 [Piromyces finnis]